MKLNMIITFALNESCIYCSNSDTALYQAQVAFIYIYFSMQQQSPYSI